MCAALNPSAVVAMLCLLCCALPFALFHLWLPRCALPSAGCSRVVNVVETLFYFVLSRKRSCRGPMQKLREVERKGKAGNAAKEAKLQGADAETEGG